MTQLSDKEHDAQMADMASFDEQMPSVGIFWYDPEDHTLFGVRKKELTPREVEEAAEKGMSFIKYPVDIKSKPEACGGCVMWNKDKFVIQTGKWAEPIQQELSELIEQEFSLPCFEFVYDEHWDLGHGWSGDMPTSR